MTNLDDSYYKKTAALNIGGLRLSFRVSQTLFSSHGIDAGTEFLLRTLHRTGARFEKVLDLGCGYGPIGIALKGLNPEAVLHMVDRDALAVAYAAQNALLNGIEDAMTYASMGFDDVEDKDFDLVAANIAGKASREVIASWLRDAPLYLRDQGQIAAVVVSPLEPFVSEVIGGIPGAKIVLRKRRSGHTVFIFAIDQAEGPTRLPASSFDRGDYDRTQAVFSHGQVRFSMKTVFGLPQFDSLSYRTLLLFDVLRNLDAQPTRALVLNPGQGHIPVVLSNTLKPASIDMLDRDLLALRCSERNLLLDEYDSSRISTKHQPGIDDDGPKYDLIVADMRDAEGPDVIARHFRQAASHIAPGGQMAIAANSATITRLVAVCRKERLGAIKERRRRHGSSVLVVQRPKAGAGEERRILDDCQVRERACDS